MPDSGNRQGRCADCGCSNSDHEFGLCLGESVDKRSKKAVQCKFEWSRCLTATHPETGRGSGPAGRVDCLICPKHPKEKPRSYRVKSQAKQRTNPATESGISGMQSGDEGVISEKTKKKKRAEGVTGNHDRILNRKEKATEGEPKPSNRKDQDEQDGTKKESGNPANPKSSVTKAPRSETQESSGDELAWDQDKAEEDALAQQMRQLSLQKARDNRSDDPGTVEWKRVSAWCKDDEVVYFRDSETGHKRRTLLTAWTEETRKFGKAKTECLVFYSRKDRRAFYCESFEGDEPKADI